VANPPALPDLHSRASPLCFTCYSYSTLPAGRYEAFLGIAGFRRGMDLYFQRHDGQAVTCDDFRAAMADANGVADGLAQFEEWYLQSGTPTVTGELFRDASSGKVTLHVSQSCPPTPGQPGRWPFIPIRLSGSTPTAIYLCKPCSGRKVKGGVRPGGGAQTSGRFSCR
jgi:aminopeptidase N